MSTGSARGRMPTVRSGLVPPLADGFAARPETASGLATALVSGSVVALVSSEPEERMGPCGKTQLAAFCVESQWRSGRVALLAWVDASSRASVLAGYLEAAAAVGIERFGSAEQAAAQFTSWLAEATWPSLLVLDDLRDPADLEGLWPWSPTGTAVITTRDEKTIAGQPGVDVILVGALSTREALNYLMGRLTDDPDQRNGAIDLAIALRGDPCALTHASAVIASSTLTCSDYLRHYTDQRARLPPRQSNGSKVSPVVVTWLLSAERAEQLAPGGATRLLLGLAALLDGQPVPGPVFTTEAICRFLGGVGSPVADPDRVWEAVRALAHTGLLTIDHAITPPLVRISRAVAAQARAAIPKAALEQAAHTVADALLEAWPKQNPQPWSAAGMHGCVAALLRTTDDRLWGAEGCHPLLLRTGQSLDGAHLAGPAARYWAQLAATCERLLGIDSPHTLITGSHLAGALLAAGQSDKAVAWWQWVTAGHARLSGPGHPDTFAARVNLGHAMAAAAQPGEAVVVLEQAVADYEQARGSGHPDTIHAREELAAACQAAGQHGEAIGHYRRTLADRERLHGPGHPTTLTARENLARACRAAGRHRDAISHYKKVLAERQRVLGPNHLDTIAARRNLAAAHQTAGKIATALQLHEEVCADYQRVLGTDHPHTLARRADLVNAYYAAGRLTDATTLLRGTLRLCEQALPPGHPLIHTLRQAMTDPMHNQAPGIEGIRMGAEGSLVI